MTDEKTQNTPARDELGHWKPGSTGNPKGRLPRTTEQQSINYLRNFLLENDAQKLKDLIEAGFRHASRGNAQMMRVMLSYFWGQPAQSVDLTTDSVINVTISHERRSNSDSGPA